MYTYFKTFTTTKEEALGMVSVSVSLFSVGRLLAAPILGYLMDKYAYRNVIFFAIVASVVSHMLYTMGNLFGGIYTLVVARSLLGFGSGTLSVTQTIVSVVTDKSERTRYYSFLSAAKFFGYAIVPVIAAFLPDIRIIIIPSIGFELNTFTAPAFILTGANIILLPFAWYLLDPSIGKSEANSNTQTLLVNKSDDVQHKSSEMNILIGGVITFMIINAVGKGSISLLEAVSTASYQSIGVSNESSACVSNTALWYAYLSIAGLAVYTYMTLKPKKYNNEWWVIQDINLLFLSFTISAVGFFINAFPLNGVMTYAQLSLGTILTWSIGGPIMDIISTSMFSLIVSSKKAGLWMGWNTAAGSIGRIVLPMLATVASTEVASSVAGMLSIFSMCILVFYLSWKRSQEEKSSSVSCLNEEEQKLTRMLNEKLLNIKKVDANGQYIEVDITPSSKSPLVISEENSSTNVLEEQEQSLDKAVIATEEGV